MVERRRRRRGPLNIAKREPEYIYHWNRIIGALFVLVLAIGLLGYGIHAWLTPSPLTDTPPPQAETTPEATLEGHPAESPVPPPRAPGQAVAQPPASPSIPASTDAEPVQLGTTWGPTPEQEAAIGTDPRQEGLSASGPQHEPPLATDREQEPADAADAAEPTAMDRLPSAEAAAASPTSGESPAAQAPDPSPSVKAQPEPEPELGQATAEPDGSGVRARSQDISLSSAAVKRFSLAQSVLNREPRGDLDDITYNAAGFTSVSAFSEVIGLNGEVLHYRWLQEGTEVAVVRVRVGANRWRSHSTKRMDRSMEGPWRVELLDSKGTLLASIDFVF